MKFNFLYPIAGLSTTAASAALFNLSNTSKSHKEEVDKEFQRPASHHYNPKQLRSNHDHNSERIKRAEAAVQRFMTVNGIPGLSIGVTVNQKTVWQRGFGVADVETGAPCHGHTVTRIASISKSITSAIAAKLMETGQLDLDKSIYEYLPDYPKKKVENVDVDITTRQLLSHMSGVRHYPKQSSF
uniref:Beta-lactamase-related domain-containing protein n=1 Tax=Ditylenchus dipsaci TaxID=166011 RepID=A0A915D6U9_9BILA